MPSHQDRVRKNYSQEELSNRFGQPDKNGNILEPSFSDILLKQGTTVLANGKHFVLLEDTWVTDHFGDLNASKHGMKL